MRCRRGCANGFGAWYDNDMSDLISYELNEGIATLAMDDGKVNAMSIPMLQALHLAFDRAESDRAIVLLTGREGIFSAGFDLKTMRAGQGPMMEMLRLGATLAAKIMVFPFPVVTACTGHAYPAGAFLMLSADRRIGIEGPFKIGMNEVAIGLPLPRFAVEIARHRLTPPYFHRVVTGDMYGPTEAVAAGFLDEIVPAEELAKRSRDVALDLCKIDLNAHVETKRRIRDAGLTALNAAIDTELR